MFARTTGPPSVSQHLRYTRAIWARTVSALQNLVPNYDMWSATPFDATRSGYSCPLADSTGERRPNPLLPACCRILRIFDRIHLLMTFMHSLTCWCCSLRQIVAALRSRVARLSYYFVRFSAWISLRAAAFRPWRFVRPRFGAELSSYASTFSSAGAQVLEQFWAPDLVARDYGRFAPSRHRLGRSRSGVSLGAGTRRSQASTKDAQRASAAHPQCRTQADAAQHWLPRVESFIEPPQWSFL